MNADPKKARKQARKIGILFPIYLRIFGKKKLKPIEYARFMGLHETWVFFSTRISYNAHSKNLNKILSKCYEKN